MEQQSSSGSTESVRFVLTVDESDRINADLAHGNAHKGLAAAFSISSVILTIVVTVSFYLLFPSSQEEWLFVLVGVVVAPIALVFIMGLLRFLYRPQRVEHDAQKILYTTVRLTPEGLVQENSVEFLRVAWRIFDLVRDGGEFIFLHTRPDHAVTIPARAFDSQKDATAFVRKARQYIAEASETGEQ